jgi:hypothetical protein
MESATFLYFPPPQSNDGVLSTFPLGSFAILSLKMIPVALAKHSG